MSKCRLCLQTDPSIYIFDQVKTLPEKIWNCCQLTVTEDDGLSNLICSSCEIILESFNEFKCICEKSEAFLKEQHSKRLNIKIENSDNSYEEMKVMELSCNEFNIKEEIPYEENFLSETKTAVKECLLEVKSSNKRKSKHGTIKYKKPKKKISCEICGKIVSSTLKRHMLQIHNINPSCGESDKKEKVRIVDKQIPHLYDGLESIKKKNSQYGKRKCQICGKVLNSNLKRHIRLVHKDYSSLVTTTLSEFISAQVKESDNIKDEKELFLKSDTATTCNICGKFIKSSSLGRHMLKVHREEFDRTEDIRRNAYENENEKLPCRICNKLIPMTNMRNHIKLQHDTNVMLRCDICNEEFREKRSLKKHLYVKHNSSDTFECDLCQKVFYWKPNIVRHLRRHMYPSLVNKFGCNQCDVKTDSNYRLRKHVLAVHMNVRPYQCSVCGKLFKTLNSQKGHMRQHEDRYYFECDYCGKKFNFKNVMVSHIISHMQIKLYQCNICNKKLASKAILKCHMYLHTGENPFACKLCDKRFKQRCNLKSHLRHFHKMSQLQL